MKKALAVALAVMMLSTLAFAAAALAPVTTVSGTSVPAYIETKPGDNYILKICDQYFTVFNGYGSLAGDAIKADDITPDNFKVQINGTGVSVAHDSVYGFYIPVKNEDKPVDLKADLTITDLTITYGDPAKKNVVVYAGSDTDGHLNLKSLTVGGIKYTVASTWDTTSPLYTSYDVGRKNTTYDDTANITAEGWYKNDASKTLEFPVNAADTVCNIVVPAKTFFKVEKIGAEVSTSVAGVSMTKHAPSLKVVNATLRYEYPGDLNSNFYCVRDGKAYTSGLAYADGKWTKTCTESMALYEADKALPADKVLNSAPADPKNPATGANDVVGVAAALAVVALVSGAAISLKK